MLADNLRRLGILIVLTGVMLMAVVLLAFSYVEVGITDIFEGDGIGLTADDFAAVPESVLEDAGRLSRELYGNSQAEYESFVVQLLQTYLEAEDKDFIVIFNSGGWGWSSPVASGWRTILEGINTELTQRNYRVLLLNYQRTSASVQGVVKEFVEAICNYPSKGKDLAARVQFVTTHLPQARVVVTGESNGTVISDNVMTILRDNPQVYSIQTGNPFWHQPAPGERTLLLDSNGTGPDTFSEGDIPALIWASIQNFLGLMPAEETPGTVMKVLRAPGHDYSWQYPQVCMQISRFLAENFGIPPGQSYESGSPLWQTK